jgi:hypothetical protein
LLDITDRFRIHSKLYPMEEIAAGRSVVAFGGRAIDLTVPQQRIDAGGSETRDWFKLIACEQMFEADAFDLPVLDGVLPTQRSASRSRSSSLDQLADRIATRDAGDEASSVSGGDWTTAMVTVVTERPTDADP